MNKKHFFNLSFLVLNLFLIQCQAKSGSESPNPSVQIKSYPNANGSISFVEAAAITTPCVVHIKTKADVNMSFQDPFQGFFGSDFFEQFHFRNHTQKQEGSGSGVIVSKDGYIVTNYHVIQNADEIEVTLRNKNVYKAKVIGTDKDSDLALIKIDEKDLPTISIANSDSVLVGEWVLAVGNPFNLESTVTQGIVSAKGRALHPDQSRMGKIESFIQTDAAVNPGNSGGALVNLKGELIGINTAIASPTGSYAGYAFAVPSNLVNKVIVDLKKHGNVQRSFLGIESQQLTSEKAKELKLNSPNGVWIHKVVPKSAAEEAGLRTDDVIIKIGNNVISTFPELLEQISTNSPGDRIEITYLRDGNQKTTYATLKNKNNSTEIIKAEKTDVSKLGIQIQAITSAEKTENKLQYGLKITKIEKGIISQSTDLKPGFIITAVNDKPVKTVEEFNEIIKNKSEGRVIFEGVYPGRPFTFQYAFNL